MNKPSDTKLCPHCRQEVDLKATKCPHCQSDLRSWVRKHPIWTVVLVMIFAIFTIQSITDTSVPATPAQNIAEMKKHDFASFAKSYIEPTLKAPSTAKFDTSPTVTQDEKDPNSFEILSYVDSQNSFGAMIRSSWSLKAHYIGDDTQDAIEKGSNWRIDEVIFDGKKIK